MSSVATQIDQLDFTGIAIPNDISGIDVLMHDVVPMQFSQRMRDSNGQIEPLMQQQGFAKIQMVQRRAAKVFNEQDPHALM